MRAKRQAAELRVQAGNARRAAALFVEMRRTRNATPGDELYATQRLADLYSGALGDEGRALVELRRTSSGSHARPKQRAPASQSIGSKVIEKKNGRARRTPTSRTAIVTPTAIYHIHNSLSGAEGIVSQGGIFPLITIGESQSAIRDCRFILWRVECGARIAVNNIALTR